ncbi:MAG: acyltransferase [Lachnospiraceae bacterium]|nr:acyltransferase [Lachnospiraceae bacterium]
MTHYEWEDKYRFYGLFPLWVDMAVPVFMMISGYVYSTSFYNNRIEEFAQAYDLLFLFKKIIRYTIPFLIALGIEFLVSAIRGNLLSVNSMVVAFFTGGYGPGSYYYPQMIQFIFIFPVIYFTVKSNPKFGVIGWFVFNAFYELIKRVIGVNDSIYRLEIYRYTFLIAFGCYIFMSKEKTKKRNWIAFFFIGMAYIIVTKYLGYETKIINNAWRGTSFIVAFYIAPIFNIIIKKCSSFHNKPLSLLGKASFNIFLTQMVYYYFVSAAVYSILDNTIVQLVANIVICSLVGVLFYFAESKFTTWFIGMSTPTIIKIKRRLDAA